MANKSKSRKMNKTRNRHRRAWSRRNRKNQMGGMAPLGDTSMLIGQKDNLSQGTQFLNIHRAQHGGAGPYPTAVTDSVLSGSMIAAARTGPLDVAMAQTRGMQDGGRRRGSKGKKSGRSRKHRGGSRAFMGASLSENSMLLPSGLERQAALNHDWSAAKDPNYWAPSR